MAGKEGQKNRFWSDEGKVATRTQARVPSEFPGDQFPGKRWRPARRRGCLEGLAPIFHSIDKTLNVFFRTFP